jgi:hypothetical protein
MDQTTTTTTQPGKATTRSEPFLVGFNPTKPLPIAERKLRLDGYMRFLRERDGEPDVAKRTLSRREAWFREIEREPIRYSGAVDRAAFRRYIHERPGPEIDPKLAWILATAKSNRVEHYGVTLDFKIHGDVGSRFGEHMPYIDLEEFYHTRILRECVRVFELEFELEPPKTFTRFFAELVVRSPHWGRLVTALCGELFGAVGFLLLWEKTALFADDPKACDRLRSLIREILIDEMGHAAYGHAKLGRAGIAIVRAASPMVASYFLADLPEFSYLAGGKAAFLKRVAAFDLGSNKELWARA